MTPTALLRPSPIAGVWYDDDPHQLAHQIDAYLEQASLRVITGEVIAIIVPHAGHIYSGRTAAHAFKCLTGRQFDLVVIVSPMHPYHPAVLITSAHAGYETPLGPVWIDQEAVQQVSHELKRTDNAGLASIANDQEHSLEIQLPFLQRVLQPGFKLLPIMIRSQSRDLANALGSALASVAKPRNALLIASSDLSHFYPLTVANRLDREMLQQITSLSPEGVLKAEQAGKGFACGAAAIAAVLWAALASAANQAEIVHYSTSAEETGDLHSVVGYGAAVIYRQIP
jgi:AmmeMemoRadiSam system protein B